MIHIEHLIKRASAIELAGLAALVEVSVFLILVAAGVSALVFLPAGLSWFTSEISDAITALLILLVIFRACLIGRFP